MAAVHRSLPPGLVAAGGDAFESRLRSGRALRQLVGPFDVVQPARDLVHVQAYRRQRFGGRLAEQLPEAVLQPLNHSRRGFFACGRRYRDDAASYASNRVENGARGPENEPFKGAGSHALGAQSFRRPCNVDILAPETMLADPSGPVSIVPAPVLDFAAPFTMSRPFYVQEAHVQRCALDRFNLAPHMLASCLPAVSPLSSPHTQSTHALAMLCTIPPYAAHTTCARIGVDGLR